MENEQGDDITELSDILAEVGTELRRATSLHGSMNSGHEGYAVLKEEVDELWDDIKTNAPLPNQRAEAIQIAAMAVRYILDVTGDGKVPPQSRVNSYIGEIGDEI